MYGNFKNYQTNNRRRRNIPENVCPEIPMEEIEDIYEEIDESTMIANFENFHGSKTSVTDRIKSYSLSDNNCYLTPYQPVDEDSISNNSNEDQSESSKSSDLYDQTANNRDVQWRRSSYLNPYQPIVHSADIHEYLSIHNTNDYCSSGSESLTRESGDLNPNKPMIQTMELQEYKSFHGCLSGSGSSLSDTCTT
ncbi:unnamed protein product [Mytilus coruscus]|uniref:Uncharacterized protein n=1 Tax=Mytilus coruscus TaxID=42192 RepID=A0A6J8C0U1_MYTCO|nr:unnamed protein product [Mytilus coruscus]